MLPFSMFLALQPSLEREWTLSNTGSGWISSAYFAGYMIAVPVLSSLTDRVDARTVWLGACAVAAAGAIGFALGAEGVWSAAAFQVVGGASLAGTYMPGLKVIADRLPQMPRPRHVAFYTTSFTAGAGFSFAAVGFLGAHYWWRTAVLVTAIGPLVSWVLVATLLPPVPIVASAHPPSAHWRAVFASGATMRYVVGYSAHTWELFALRAWVVPFATFCAAFMSGEPPVAPSTIAALVALVGIPASIAGAELTSSVGRQRLIVAVMLGSVAASLLVLPSTYGGWLLTIAVVVLYSALVSADSAALTSAVLHVAPPASRGTAMAVYSTLGFAAAAAGTFAVGAMLDLMGGQSVGSWAVAFAVMSMPNVLGAWAMSRRLLGS